jgi:hypothetical protein
VSARKHALGFVALSFAALAAVAVPSRARAVEFTLAGSTQLDYHFVPFNPGNVTDPRPRSHTIDGLTEELSIKVALDFSSHISGNVKLCWGCHGFELGMAFVDFRVNDALNFRVGRFNPQFGEFQLRHDPGNHRTSDKPLPYDMGRMFYLYQFNRSVLPLPYVENAVEVSGSHFFGSRVQVDYAAHIATGLRATVNGPTDVDFISMHAPSFMVDNNSLPSVGGRVGVNVRLADRVDWTVGGSALHGAYDPQGLFTYTVLGIDTFLRIGRVNIRGEYLIRRTEMATGQDPTRWQYELPLLADRSDFTETLFMVKDGFYVEVDGPVNRRVELVGRFDGIRRIGNVPVGVPLDFNAGMLRGTLGANFIIARGYRVKSSVEYWRVWGVRSDLGNPVPENGLGLHLGVVATF